MELLVIFFYILAAGFLFYLIEDIVNLIRAPVPSRISRKVALKLHPDLIKRINSKPPITSQADYIAALADEAND